MCTLGGASEADLETVFAVLERFRCMSSANFPGRVDRRRSRKGWSPAEGVGQLLRPPTSETLWAPGTSPAGPGRPGTARGGAGPVFMLSDHAVVPRQAYSTGRRRCMRILAILGILGILGILDIWNTCNT